jgi:NADH-quinone oxidoreductase subunit A
MLTEFGKVFLFFLLGIIFVAAGLLVAKLLRPHNPTYEKNMSYECGEEPIGPPWTKFNIRFYVIALIFLLFDVELVVLFPWAMIYQKLGMASYVAGAIFILILFLADFYLWAKGDLEWERPQPNIPNLRDLVDSKPVIQVPEHVPPAEAATQS